MNRTTSPATIAGKAVRLLFSLALVLGLMPTLSVAASPGRAFADAGSVYTYNTGGEAYDGYSTNYFVADGHPAWCAEPFRATPGDGWYSYDVYRPSGMSNPREWRALAIVMIAATLNCSWDKNMNIGTPVDNCDRMLAFNDALEDAANSGNLDDSFYCRMHVLLSYCFNEAMGWGVDAFAGATNPDEWRYQSEKLWGYALTAADGNGVAGLFSADDAKEMAAIADNSLIAMTHSGSSAQNLIWVSYVGEGSGALELTKTSSNAQITDNSLCYSLTGAVYGVYPSWDEAASAGKDNPGNPVATLVTNSDRYAKAEGVRAGQYYVKETSAPMGYALDSNVYPVYVSAGATAQVNGGTVTDSPTTDPVGMMVSKVDPETGETSQGDGSLEGAVFEVKYYDGWYDESNLPANATKTWRFSTNENGFVRFEDSCKISGDSFYYDSYNNPILPLGTVTIEEVSAPEGYLLPAGRSERYSLQRLTDDSHLEFVHMLNMRTQPDSPEEGAAGVFKLDSITGNKAQGDAWLSGIEFSIYNASDHAVVNKDGETVQPGGLVQSIITDDAGSAATGARDLPYGTYRIKETATNESMLNTSREQTIEVREDGKMYSVEATDDVVRGNVLFEKRDKETDDNWALYAGDADLAATFSIVNKSRNAVVVQGRTCQPNDVVYTATAEKTADGWVLRTPDRLLPYGTYEIKEVGRPTGYLGTSQAIEFKIRTDGQTVNLGDHTFVNQIARADILFQKKDDSTKQAMAGVPFLLVNLDAEGNELESHVVVTDKNGIVDTSTQRGTVNAFDGVVSGDSERGYAVDEDKLATLVSKQDAADTGTRSGVWFGLSHDGTTTVSDKTLGALTYGRYKLVELPCKANEGRQLITDEFTVGTSDHGSKLDLGTLDDMQAELHTSAYDGTSGDPSDRRIIADEEAKIVDRVTYQDFVPGRTYEMRAELHYADDGSAVSCGGTAVTATKQFTPMNKNGYVELELSFDGSLLEAGRDVVVYEYATWDGQDIAEHADKDDAEQTIVPLTPGIGTQASSEGAKTVKADPAAALTDTVGYSNLREGASYTLTLELMSKSTGTAVLGADGKPVTATKTFTAASESGTVDVELTFDATALADGEDLVCYETLERLGSVIAEHKDLSDEGQTVEVKRPTIGTTLTDKATEDHDAAIDDQVTLVDRVEYNGLIADGREYTVTGQLQLVAVDGSGNKSASPYLDADGRAVTATATFVPDTPHGYADVTFTFNGLNLEDKSSLVCYETLTRAGVELASHADASDKGQTVRMDRPTISTTAKSADGDKSVKIDPEAGIVDTVSYKNLREGSEYTLTLELMSKSTGEALAGADGKPVTATKTFTADWTRGSVDVELTFDATALADGEDLVCYETLERLGSVIAEHKDLSDEGQTVEVKRPTIGTTATSAQAGHEGSKDVARDATATVVDSVAYSDVVAGKAYTVEGTLMDKSTGEALKGADGKPVTAQASFTPQDTYGTVELTFAFDSSALEGHELVAFETVRRDGIEIASHKDLSDEGQTVKVVPPEIRTDATSSQAGHEGSKDVARDATATVVDSVDYSGLVAGKDYTVTGTLMVKETGEALAGADGKPVTASKTFTARDTYGTVEIEFTFDSALLEGQQLVAFEKIYQDGREVGSHENIEDENQTVKVVPPEVRTTARSSQAGHEGSKDLVRDSASTLTDTVEYNGLVIGKDYTVEGTLMDKSTGKPVTGADGKPVTASRTFTAQAAFGTIDLEFAFDSSALDGREIVAFEKIHQDGREVGAHEDIDDANQTVKVTSPALKTTAADGADGDKNVVRDPEAVIVDAVEYDGAVAGKEYSVEGVLMDKSTGEPFIDPTTGKEVTSQATFTARDTYGTVEVTFALDASQLPDGAELVVFETLKRDGEEVGSHKDIDDAAQATTVIVPELRTTAADGLDADKEVIANHEATVVDTVEYDNLVPGKTYTITGTLMVKETGEALAGADGKPVTGETTFTPESAKGSVDVTFTFDSALLAGKHLVAFEVLSRNGIEITSHADIDDEDQTVEVVAPDVHTMATDTADGDKHVSADTESSITDEVAYKNLVPGDEYKLAGILMDKSTGLPLLSGEGAEGIGADTLKSFSESIAIAMGYKEQVPSIQGDDGQWARFGEGHDVARDGQTWKWSEGYGEEGAAEMRAQTLAKNADGSWTLTVEEGRDNGDGTATSTKAAYELHADKVRLDVVDADGKAFPSKPDFEAIAAAFQANPEIAARLSVQKATFTPEEQSGTVSIDFPLDALSVGEAETVVFEFLYKDHDGAGELVAAHADIDSDDQTVKLVPPEIATKAEDKTDGDQIVLPSKDCTVVDHVSYTDLIPGKEYILRGTLMDKSTGKPLMVGDKEVTAEKAFTPNSASGTVDLEFTFDSSALDGREIVAFEKVSKDGVEIASHEDIDDANQTVTVDKLGGATGKAYGSSYSKTGIDLGSLAWLAGLLAAAGAALTFAGVRARRRAKRAAGGLFGGGQG